MYAIGLPWLRVSSLSKLGYLHSDWRKNQAVALLHHVCNQVTLVESKFSFQVQVDEREIVVSGLQVLVWKQRMKLMRGRVRSNRGNCLNSHL